ncbi:MAG: TetR/AcrR family transcriptional regulator [bacterium]|nr:TetR/AcrR family transcriptional regulator [bacterium]
MNDLSALKRNASEQPRGLAKSRKSAKKRDAILRAAIEVINVKGYAHATMAEIAATLDLGEGALYYYFPNKQALVFACHCRSLERFEALLAKADEGGGSGAAKLRCFLNDLLRDSALNGPQLYYGEFSYLDDGQSREIIQWGDRLKARLERFLTDGMADGSIIPCESRLVVNLMLGMLIWLAKWVPDVEGLTADRLMAAISAFAFQGIEAEIL